MSAERIISFFFFIDFLKVFSKTSLTIELIFLKLQLKDLLKETQKAEKYNFLQYILVKNPHCTLLMLFCFLFFFEQMNPALDDAQSHFSIFITAFCLSSVKILPSITS